jgi:hypothetical protein
MTDPADPETYGRRLLARARAHGMTGEELATLLGISVPRIRTLAGPAALDHHTSAVLRTLADRLDLPWPGWLTTEKRWPDPPAAEVRHDAARVHAVLAAAFGQPLHLSEIADVLGWTLDRVHTAANQLATRFRPGGGTRLTVTGDTLTLTLAPRMLDTAARQRLNQLLHADGLGPDPHVLYLIYRLTRSSGQRNLIDSAPDLLDEAIEHQLVTSQRDDAGEPYEVRLHPAVEYSLSLMRDPPDDPEDSQ